MRFERPSIAFSRRASTMPGNMPRPSRLRLPRIGPHSIYVTLRLFDVQIGATIGYARCPADPQGTSFAIMAAVVLR
jgi:hypothetical protein